MDQCSGGADAFERASEKRADTNDKRKMEKMVMGLARLNLAFAGKMTLKRPSLLYNLLNLTLIITMEQENGSIVHAQAKLKI